MLYHITVINLLLSGYLLFVATTIDIVIADAAAIEIQEMQIFACLHYSYCVPKSVYPTASANYHTSHKITANYHIFSIIFFQEMCDINCSTSV